MLLNIMNTSIINIFNYNQYKIDEVTNNRAKKNL